MQQAKSTGEFLKQYFHENGYNFDKVIIECSPFLRCMQTAAQIAVEVPGTESITREVRGEFVPIGGHEVKINYRASEILLKFFGENPMNDLEWIIHESNFKSMKDINE